MTCKSVGGSVFGLGHTNANEELVMSGLIHWQAKSQSIVAVSTLEALYRLFARHPEKPLAQAYDEGGSRRNGSKDC